MIAQVMTQTVSIIMLLLSVLFPVIILRALSPRRDPDSWRSMMVWRYVICSIVGGVLRFHWAIFSNTFKASSVLFWVRSHLGLSRIVLIVN